MNKKAVCKLKPGTWVEIVWEDSRSSVALLLEKPQTCNGDVSIRCFYPETGRVDSHAVHTQVVGVLGSITIPQPRLGEAFRYGRKLPKAFPTGL